MLDFWRLPGPSAFIADIANEVGAGRNVALMLPERGPIDVLHAVRDSLRDRWSIVNLAGPVGVEPIRDIYIAVLGEVVPEPARTAASLADDGRLMGALAIVEGLTDSSWPVWKRLLEEYEIGCRRLPADRRMLFVVAAKGVHARNPPASEVALAVVHWDDYVCEADMQIYAALRLRGMTIHRRKRQILVACLARMASWDVEVIERFCEVGPEQVLDPLATLASLGRERGWNDLQSPSWETGAVHHVDGLEQVHSAYLACHDPRAIDRRLWLAQASVLLPLIEERRVELLPRVARYVKFPLQTNSGLVESLEDLEIGHISWQLHAVGAERGLARTVDRLKAARDSLAHLQPLGRDACFHSDLIG